MFFLPIGISILNMTQPKTFYYRQLTGFKQNLKKLKNQSFIVSMGRLFLFFALITALYFYHQSIGQILLIFFIWLPLFLVLIAKNTDLKRKIRKTKYLIQINETEMSVLNGNYADLPDGTAYIDPNHDYSYDIDLFGKASFFQYINRSYKKSAQDFLAKILSLNSTKYIIKKQTAIKELADKPEWRQDFLAESYMVENSLSPAKIHKILKSYHFFTSPGYFWAILIFSLISLSILITYYLGYLQAKYLIYWLVFGLGIVGFYAKKIKNLYQYIDLILPSLSSYQKLLLLIENEDFNASYLNEQKQNSESKKNQPSENLEDFIKLYDRKEMTNNMIVKFIGNSLFLSDLYFAYQLEKWLKNYHTKLNFWLEKVDFFETQINLGNFAFNHPDYVFPQLNDEKKEIVAKKLGHPLIPVNKRISNDFDINRHEFFIITGANMAGKSTFLRTVALSIVMANTGLPVCADTYIYSPIKLLSSMRTSDSLQAETSYFFSELKRLQYIVQQIQKEDYFIILDEILKGTNSKDKAEGSHKFIERLTRSKATGIIATHDLSLCTLSDQYNQIRNLYFDAEIIDNELYFDYKLKKGICQNMNASFLLRKMGIVD